MNASLQTRLMTTFFLLITILTGVALLIFANARSTAALFQSGLSDLLVVVELTQAVDQGATALGQIASHPVPEQAIEGFRPIRERIRSLGVRLPESTANRESAPLVRDLANMTDSFLIEASAAVHAFRDGNLELYLRHDREAATIARYVRETADRLMAAELAAYREIYPAIMQRNRELQRINTAVLAAVTLVAAVFAWSFARGVTEPLQMLARAASRIAGGDLEGPPVPAGPGLELRLLGTAFNQMQESLRRHVAALKEKAELDAMLREAELRALQSQVNPHFLFNTLNMVAKMALIEGAERTRTLLETVADLLRYNLRKLDRPVTLADEVEQIRRYLTIQQERFRDRFRYTLDLDEPALSLPVPCLTLQPLVENGLIHGIGKREEDGEVGIQIRRHGDGVRVVVSDNGPGIPPERLRLLVDGQDPGEVRGHTTGLGIYSVRRRLELFYGRPAGFEIISSPGKGTTVVLDLPRSAEGGYGDADSGRGR